MAVESLLGALGESGMVVGSLLAASLFGELTLEGFQGGASMRRYILGAVPMGFGGMLAGGRAVGAGLSVPGCRARRSSR